MNQPIEIDPSKTALVLIDLQDGITAEPLVPRTGEVVVEAAENVAQRCVDKGVAVFTVRVDFARDFVDAPQAKVDRSMFAGVDVLPPGWSTLPSRLVDLSDVIITKRQWSAFHGTELDLQLRRRRITTVLLGGIATNFGVESTARQAWEHNYDVVVLEDLCTSVSAELHESSVRDVLPYVSRVRASSDIRFA